MILKHKKLLSSDPLKWLSPWPLCSTHTVRRKPQAAAGRSPRSALARKQSKERGLGELAAGRPARKSKNSLKEPPAYRPLPRPTFTYSDPDKVRPGTWGLGTDTLCMRNGAA